MAVQSHPQRYRIVEGKRCSDGQPHWHVIDPHRNFAQRISVYSPTIGEAERCRDVLLRDDERILNFSPPSAA